ncbi:hypothetical protein CY34DRAFT_17672 [Suillus luteus UH-Slu-Lm8-n1]|uniref:Stress response protein NST1 n=1 Tax=Suillus luteus UH-Slu-Lm8-n1 TaxID=930992 RepID=A0A0D0ARF3_9AGAM|nr:hypothetical protein CY34DRAFT_17672 [Suillus luteus UH-Slu-Lm8-n1]
MTSALGLNPQLLLSLSPESYQQSCISTPIFRSYSSSPPHSPSLILVILLHRNIMPGSPESRYIRLDAEKIFKSPPGARLQAFMYPLMSTPRDAGNQPSVSCHPKICSVGRYCDFVKSLVTSGSYASPVLSVEIRVSYEADRMLGSGKVIGKLQMSWDDLLNHGDEPFDSSLPPVRSVHPSLTLKAAVVQACDDQDGVLPDVGSASCRKEQKKRTLFSGSDHWLARLQTAEDFEVFRADILCSNESKFISRLLFFRTYAIEEELEVLYDAYYEELEQYANYQQRYVSPGGTIPPPPVPGPPPGSVELDKNGAVIALTNGRKPPKHESEVDDDDDGEEEEYEEDEVEEEEEEEEEEGDEVKPRDRRNPSVRGRRPVNNAKVNYRDGLFNLGSSFTVTGPGNILTVADDLLKNDGQKFLEMMEQLAERGEDGDDEDEEEEDDDEEVMTEEQKMEEGTRMSPISAARMFE